MTIRKIIDSDGNTTWRNSKGQIHRTKGPAVIHPDTGYEAWYQNDRLHREGDLPAITKSNLINEWWKHGCRHRSDGPAVIEPDGSVEYWWNGERHRKDGPAIVRTTVQEWWVNGKLHREDGPAKVYIDGTKKWYLNGKLHREDGPAVVNLDGSVEYWIGGIRLNFNDNTTTTGEIYRALFKVGHNDHKRETEQ